MPSFVDHVKLYCDGGCRGNPGSGAIGVLMLDSEGNELQRHAECIGNSTNNRAEYSALAKGLDLCAAHTRRRVTCYSDSQLVVNQMSGVWRLKDPTLRKLFHKVKKFEEAFEEVVYTQVPRNNPSIKKVDRMLNEAFEGR